MDRIKTNQITMKSFNILISLIAALAFTLIVTDKSHAQDDTRAQAVQLYNNAQELAGANDFEGAIDLFRDALELARQNNIDDIVELVEGNIPRVAQSKASSAYRTYQNERTKDSASRALRSFEQALEIAEEFGNEQVAQQARGAIPQLYYLRSVLEFREDNYDAALADLDTAINLNANYATAYYQKGIVLKTKNPNDIEGALEWYDKAIEAAERVNDTRTLNNARNGARDELIFRAVNLADERRFSDAIALLNRVETYDPKSATAHYRLAEIHNDRGNWDQALRHANLALEFETGGVTDKAKIYFELGTAYKGKGDISNACSAFENARYGDFAEPANHELQFELKCEGHVANGR
jgi:tetratricopeptide (TPR) repeat protein